MSAAISPARIGFRPEYLDFRRGIRVGNLQDHERITRILKLALEARYGQAFLTERWGRGVYWRWIGLLTRANREAKPLSSHVSFGCAKFFISLDPEDRLFECGMQVERGYIHPPAGGGAWRLQPDWDWMRLLAGLKRGGEMESELRRLLKEGFLIHAGSWEAQPQVYSAADFPGVRALKKALEAAPKRHWAGLQVYYAMREEEVRGAAGADLVESMLAAFEETRPLMNLVMQVRLEAGTGV